MVCPIADLIELIVLFVGVFPNTFLIEIVSALLIAGVPVPCKGQHTGRLLDSVLRFLRPFHSRDNTFKHRDGIVIWYASQR